MATTTPSDFAAAYQRYHGAIRAKCRRILEDAAEAEDIAQETFVRMWREAPQLLDDPEQALRWAYRTSTRLSLDRLRRASTRKRYSPDPGVEPSSGMEDRLDARQRLEALAREVPDEELSVAILARLDDLTQPEIARVAGISERTVRRLLSRFQARTTPLTGERP